MEDQSCLVSDTSTCVSSKSKVALTSMTKILIIGMLGSKINVQIDCHGGGSSSSLGDSMIITYVIMLASPMYIVIKVCLFLCRAIIGESSINQSRVCQHSFEFRNGTGTVAPTYTCTFLFC